MFSHFNDSSALVWEEPYLRLGDYSAGPYGNGTFSTVVNVPLSESVQRNGSLYAHIYFTRLGVSPDPLSPSYNRTGVIYARKLITRYLPKLVSKNRKNLITGEAEDNVTVTSEAPAAPTASSEPRPIVSYWDPHLTLNLVDDYTPIHVNSLPPPLQPYYFVDPVSKNYYPVLYLNDFWTFQSDLMPINETLKSAPLHLSYYPVANWKFQLMIQMDASFNLHEQWGSMAENESDEFNRMLVETNPYLLGVTMVVSMLHSVFDFLAFKNDITFWKNRKSLEGLSVRTIFTNVFFQLVILLYLMDNDTSWLIIISSFVGLLIEVWKISKAVVFHVDHQHKLFGVFPRLRFHDRKTYRVSKTKEYDELAFKYLSYLLFPLLVCYSIYSLVYETHKSWYSWILASLVGAVYTFGFIMMTPQLFINYKLQSVAHLPWRMLTYKALNTFIDDLFAFIIKMPTMHRLACFRDDIIFFIYLYQRWKYPVDASRRHEFEGDDNADDDAEEDNRQIAAIEGEPSQATAGTEPVKTEAEKKTD
eukprot:Opistho-1_new@58879